jgi:L-ascorbate metabolism protein UlaG (beta-lactamase superfamily)
MALNRGFRLTWLGQMTFRLDTKGGMTVLIDPWVEGNPVCPPEFKSFEKIDVIAITHGHSDHMSDAVTLGKKFNPITICIPELAHFLRKKGLSNVSGMNKGGSQKAAGLTFTMVNALHSSGIEDGGTMVYGGDPAGYVITLEDGMRIYHAGDTAVFGDMKYIGQRYKPDLALVPIGGNFTMDPQDAAWAVKELIQPKAVIPMHYGANPLAKGTAKEFVDAMGSSPVKVVVAVPGSALRF